jgi:hypothetical protein
VARAQNAPPLRILVNGSAGSSVDLLCRTLADGLRERLARAVVVDNRVGAGGFASAMGVRGAPADGSVLIQTNIGVSALSPLVFRKLRRGHWILQGEIDLHGLTREEARVHLAAFLSECARRGTRCIRVIHGKGLRSRNKEPVLKAKVAHWLAQRDEVLAFCEATPRDGGSGAMFVLLKARERG